MDLRADVQDNPVRVEVQCKYVCGGHIRTYGQTDLIGRLDRQSEREQRVNVYA